MVKSIKKNVSIVSANNLLLALILFYLNGCSHKEAKQHIVTLSNRQATQKAEQIRKEIAPKLANDNLVLNLWASDTLLQDPIGLDMDHQGRAWVTITNRSTADEFDIRGHRDWMIRSIAFKTLQDRIHFLHDELAPKNSEKNKWLPDYNKDGSRDWNDLTLHQEEILKIEDTSGDGIADRSQRYTKDFHKEYTDVLGAIFHYKGSVYAGVAPDMWKLTDTNDDGMADEKESLSHGYGVHVGFSGHGMSGLTMGPDGRLYWGIGDIGSNIVGPDGKKWSFPNQGAVFRCDPDGSNFEVFAHGVRNTHEITFDKYGNLIAVDNDGDHAGEYERVVYLVDGSDSGWRSSWQYGKYVDPKNNKYNVWMDENYFHPRFKTQAAHLLPPVAPYHPGPAGMAYNPGTALSPKWRNHFFSVEYTGSTSSSGINTFTLKPDGAGFDLASDEVFMKGIQATGLDVGPDGALYFADWITGWDTKDRGRIWKLDTKKATHSDLRKQTQRLLAENFEHRSKDELLDLLKHPDMRVREKAQFELVDQDDAQTLLSAIQQTDHQLARLHGIWGIGQLARKNIKEVQPLLQFLDDSDPRVRAQAAKVLGDVRYQPAAGKIIPLLKDKSSRVAFFAAEALGRLKYHPAIQPIINMVATHHDNDVYLRHGSAIALARIGDPAPLVDLADHPSAAVRIVAVVALRRLNDPGLARFLDDKNEFIVTNAARAINDDKQIKQALPALAKMLDQNRFTNTPLLRRAINACLYDGTAEDAMRLATFSTRQGASDSLRVEAIQTLSVWPYPSTLDRVTGRYRGEIHRDTTKAQKALASVINPLLTDKNPKVKVATLQAVSNLDYQPASAALFGLVKNDSAPEVRIAALKSLQQLGSRKLDEAVDIALKDQQKDVRMKVLGMIPSMNLSQKDIIPSLKYVLNNGSYNEQQSALKALGQINNDASNQVLANQLDQLIKGGLAPEIQLDAIEAARETGDQQLLAKLEEYEAAKPRNDSLATYREVLKGGDAASGKHLFYQNNAAQCVRCHALGDQGGNVGPDLSHIGSTLNRKQLLQALVQPSARISPGFGNVSVTLQNNDQVQGTLLEETDSYIIIQTGSDKSQKISKPEITKRQNMTSAMPLMGNILSKNQLRDLIEFLHEQE